MKYHCDDQWNIIAQFSPVAQKWLMILFVITFQYPLPANTNISLQLCFNQVYDQMQAIFCLILSRYLVILPGYDADFDGSCWGSKHKVPGWVRSKEETIQQVINKNEVELQITIFAICWSLNNRVNSIPLK